MSLAFHPPLFPFASPLNMFMALQGMMGSWFWSDFSLMKTLGGSACPLLSLFFHVQVVMCMYFCVCTCACLCLYACAPVSVLLKSSPLSVIDDTDMHSDRQEVEKAAGLWWSPGLLPCTPTAAPRSCFHPLFLRGWTEGCRLMKRVWTTRKSGSHLADTPAHLWPSESSHHDRPPPPPTPAFRAPSLPPRQPTFPWVRPRRLAARSLPNTAHPRWHQTAKGRKRKRGGANRISNEEILFVMKMPSLCRRRVLPFQVRSKKTTELGYRADTELFLLLWRSGAWSLLACCSLPCRSYCHASWNLLMNLIVLFN